MIDVYQTPRWKAARRRFLAANPICIDCKAEGVIRASTVVDHAIPHRGDPELLWNDANFRARCKPHHDAKTAREVNQRRSG